MAIYWLILLLFCGCNNQEEEVNPDEIAFIEEDEGQKEFFFSNDVSLQEQIIHQPAEIQEDETE